VRPVLKPAISRVWRGSSTLQFGIDPDTAVVLDPVDKVTARLLLSLDGTRDLAGVRSTAAGLGIDNVTTDRLLATLRHAGVLDDAASPDRPLSGLIPEISARLEPDLHALATRCHRPGTASARLTRRRLAHVQLIGGGRFGAPIATALAASGVGHLTVIDPDITQPADLAPGGLTADDLGTRRETATAMAIARVAPEVTATCGAGELPDLAIIAATRSVAELTRSFLSTGTPHLMVSVRDGTGVVGPLVVPGQSSCLRCLDLTRTDRDPQWPQIAAQLADHRRPMACEAALAVALAGHAALHALTFLDGEAAPATVNGTIEVRADGRVGRRSWVPHPRCGCRAG
jgi:hypothetical protein